MTKPDDLRAALTVRDSHFGPWIDGLPGPLVVLAVREYETKPMRLLLPHQVYVKDVLALAGRHCEVFVCPVPTVHEWLRVDDIAAAYNADVKEPTP